MWGSVPLSPQGVRCPAVTASGTVQGQKGVRFLPDAKRGNNSAPVRQVGIERGAGAHFLTRKLTVQNRQQGAARIWSAWRCAAALTTIAAARAFLASMSETPARSAIGMWGSVPLSLRVVGSPEATASGTVQEQKGAVSSPVRRGKQQRSRAASRRRTRRGSPFFDKKVGGVCR